MSLLAFVFGGKADSELCWEDGVLAALLFVDDKISPATQNLPTPLLDVNSEAEECNGSGFAVSRDDQQNLSSPAGLPERFPFSDAHNGVILAAADHELSPAPLQGDQVDAYTSDAVDSLETQPHATRQQTKKRKLTTDQDVGPIHLSSEEKSMLLREGYRVPTEFPLTRAEQKALKIVRRKISNKIEQVKASNSRLISYIEEMLRTFSDRSVEQSKLTTSRHPVSN
ncbi:Cyclic AMP-responsive element-binding protein 3-like protein 1 [Toxocara canis]|uniref:Cyclic AMP-responsive element-binding protein 3-like protein 1 n=1 Tax=Toxocara canis TaxID=6265 RepID=A0A0B2V5C1_TOXCA|nr:Cyclic AMP-responsive element-binding protein 3-like protein 1 [Toxocara canis]